MQNLIVFAKRPILGKVKTRLASDIGEDMALEIYKNMLDSTSSLATTWVLRSDCFRFVHWFWDRDGEPEPIEEEQVFIPTYYEIPKFFIENFQETNKNLGDRMAIAFEKIFLGENNDESEIETTREIWKNELLKDINTPLEDMEGNPLPKMGTGVGTVIIGTDCLELNLEILEQAFEVLNEVEVVVGPALDGGYYLLGMDNFYPELFMDIEWSTENVLPKTLKNARELELTVERLPILRDIDTVEDLVEN